MLGLVANVELEQPVFGVALVKGSQALAGGQTSAALLDVLQGGLETRNVGPRRRHLGFPSVTPFKALVSPARGSVEVGCSSPA
jgi:hypothetical protein